MRSGSFKADVVALQRVDKNPVRLQMTVAASGEISPQRMILIFCRKLISLNQQIENNLQFLKVKTSFVRQLDVLLELPRPAKRPHKPRSA
jgi:hypothetical protein